MLRHLHLILAASFLFACAPETEPDGTATPSLARDGHHYVDEQAGYSLYLPDGWTPEHRRGVSIALVSPERDSEGFSDHVTVEVQPNPAAVAMAPELLDLFATKLKQQVKRDHGVAPEKEGYAMMAGRKAAWIRYRAEERGLLLAHQSYVIPGQKQNFILRMSSRSENFAAVEMLFAQIARSFKTR